MTYTETEQILDGTATHVAWPRGDLSFDLDADGRVLTVTRTNDQVRQRDLEDVIRELRHPDMVQAAHRQRIAAYIDRVAASGLRPSPPGMDGGGASRAWAQVAEWCRDETIWNSDEEGREPVTIARPYSDADVDDLAAKLFLSQFTRTEFGGLVWRDVAEAERDKWRALARVALAWAAEAGRLHPRRFDLGNPLGWTPEQIRRAEERSAELEKLIDDATGEGP